MAPGRAPASVDGNVIKKVLGSSKEVVALKTYQVRAKRWKHGWELHIADVG